MPSTLFTHRTIDRFPNFEYEIHPFETSVIPFEPGSKFLCLGEDWLERLFGHRNLNKVRGYRLYYKGIPTMATYTHMDCWDTWGSGEDDDDDDKKGNDKDASPTKRSNYLFWAMQDFEKLLTPPRPHAKYIGRIAPKMQYIVDWINAIPTNSQISLDIENRQQDNILDCIGLGRLVSASSIEVLVVPFYRFNDRLAYTTREITQFWHAMYKLLLRRDITIVGQNLAFDLSILHHYYRLPLPDRVYDTMLFMHRHWPLADKSLSHVISYYTDAMENHKGDFCPNITQSNETQLFAYNGKDVYWTLEAARRQQELAATMSPAFQQCIADAMEAQRTTLLMTFTGMLVNKTKLEKRCSKLQIKAAALQRICEKLTGIIGFNPGAAKQCADFFYKELGYEITNYTESGAPQMDEETMYELQLKQDNPLFPLIVAYRGTAKQNSTLHFKPYIKHNAAL